MTQDLFQDEQWLEAMRGGARGAMTGSSINFQCDVRPMSLIALSHFEKREILLIGCCFHGLAK